MRVEVMADQHCTLDCAVLPEIGPFAGLGHPWVLRQAQRCEVSCNVALPKADVRISAACEVTGSAGFGGDGRVGPERRQRRLLQLGKDIGEAVGWALEAEECCCGIGGSAAKWDEAGGGAVECQWKGLRVVSEQKEGEQA